MKVLTNIPDPLLIHGVASLLVRALATDPGEVFLVSPWLRNVRLPIADVGSFRAALGGDLDEIPLADLLERVAHRHSLYLITKPPAELVNIQLLRRIMDKQTARRRIVEHADLAGLDLVDELTSDIDNDVRELALSAANHVETLRIVHRVCAAGARVAFLDRLHAKLLWTPQGVLVGSANFTNGGLGSNDELMLEVTDSATHTALLATIRLMGSRAVTSENYRLVREIAAVGLSPNDLLTRALEPRPEDPPPLTNVLALIAPFLHERPDDLRATRPTNDAARQVQEHLEHPHTGRTTSSMIRDNWTDCEHWFDERHIKRVWAAVEKNFSPYFSTYTQQGLNDHLKKSSKAAIIAYVHEAGLYHSFLDADAVDEYRADPRQFCRDLQRDLPLIRTLIHARRDELEEWKIRFKLVSAKNPAELLRVFANQARFASELKRCVDIKIYGSIDDVGALAFEEFDQGAEDDRFAYSADHNRNPDGHIKFGKYHIAGVIGLGIITKVLWYHAPGHLPHRGWQSLVALHFLSGKKDFSLPSRTSEFLMYTPLERASRIEHNFYYPYSLFTLYSLRIARLIEKGFAALNVPFDPAYRFVLTEDFLKHVAEQHVDETRDWIQQDAY